MTRRVVLLLTLFVLGSPSAFAQNEAARAWQDIRDGVYGTCIKAAQFGSGAELQANCSCSADVAMSLISDEFKHALADGTQASFQGPKLKGDDLSRNVTLLRTCPKVGAYLKQQCASDPDTPHCQVLDRALEQAQ
jgi:hypothetical protein